MDIFRKNNKICCRIVRETRVCLGMTQIETFKIVMQSKQLCFQLLNLVVAEVCCIAHGQLFGFAADKFGHLV